MNDLSEGIERKVKKPAIVMSTTNTPSGWMIVFGHGCQSLAEMEEYVEIISGGNSTSGKVKIVDLDGQDLAQYGLGGRA